MAVLNWLLGIFLSLIPKRIAAGNFLVAVWLRKLATLRSREVAVRIQPQAYGACMEKSLTPTPNQKGCPAEGQQMD